MAGKQTPNAFAIALESFISDIKREEDIRSPFYKEVLSQLNHQAPSTEPENGNHGNAEQLALFINELDARQKKSSYTRKITARLEPLITGLNQYTKACDVMIQAGPSAGALIYGGARIVLQLAEKFRKCFEDVVAMMESVGHLLRCYNVFATAYEASTEMQQLLVATYKSIICFWQKAAKLFSRKGYKTLLSGIVKPLDLEWQRCRQALEDDSKRVTMFAQATEAGIRREKELKKESTQQAKLRSQIIEWIKAGQEEQALDVREDIRTHLEIRHDDTCDWLFDHPDMDAWLKSKKSTYLWYSASPGSGKTILSSAVVRKLQDKGFKTATFFCSFNDLVRKRAITAIRSIALQLIGPSDNIPEKVKRLYEEDLTCHRAHLGDLKVAVEVLEAFMKQQSRIHIIVDGLDECEERLPLLTALCHLLHAKTYGIVKFFFSSRPDSDIRRMMRKHGVNEIEAPQQNLMNDIRLYVAHRLDNCCDPCTEKWTTESEGNFLWVRHMMDILDGEHTTCEDEIDEELQKFPKGLTGCYTRSLSRLSERPERHQQLAQSIFTMVVGAVQPLRLREITHALAASKGQPDFSPKSLPKPELIEELCSNLIIFDRTSQGGEDDPLLKIAHKSIQDFFVQDPDTLDLPDPKLKAYFVTPEKAYLELGLSSLNYLSYRRYGDPQDVTAIIGQENHAFLQHAAIFWHRYLNDTDPSLELSKKVVEFARSEAFWTCTAVQSHYAPHLFARYIRTFGGYNLTATGLKSKKEKCVDDVCYAFPLPTWLDNEAYSPAGARTVEAFHHLVTEWHSVLNTHPGAIDQCVMDAKWEKEIPGRAAWQDSRGKLFPLKDGKLESISVVDVKADRNTLMAQVLARDPHSGLYSTKWIQLFDEIAGPPKDPEPVVERPFCQISSAQSAIFSAQSTLDDGYWKIDDSRFNIQYYPPGSPDRPTKSYTSARALGEWRLLSSAVNNSSSPSQSTVAVQCSKSSRPADDIFATQSSSSESGYASMASSDHETDSDSDDGTLGYGNVKPLHNCILVLKNDSTPHWHFWKSKIDTEAQSAFHPKEPTAVWSPAPHELCIMDLESGQVQATILPEPVDAKFSNIFATRKDFHFSESGDTLYYLLYTAETLTTSIRQTVSLSSFLLNLQESEYVLERTHSTISLVYESPGPLMHPLILTHWGDNFVHVALPPLSCNPKIIRIPFSKGDSSSLQGNAVQTLREPIYFPYSTPYRNPAIQPHTVNSRREKFILSLGAEYNSCDSANSEFEKTKEAAIMTWDFDLRKAWRPWDDERDSKDQGVKDSEEVYQKLRGSFVDKDRSFGVPVRSGLDWRRQAFLSCA